MSCYIDDLNREIFPFIEWDGYDRYPTLEPQYIQRNLVKDLRHTSTLLFRVFRKAAAMVKTLDGEELNELFDALGIPVKMRDYVLLDIDMALPSILSRFDYVLGTDGKLKVVELNADTPCAVVEAFYGNGVAAKHYGRLDPNYGEEERLKSFLLNNVYHSFDMLHCDFHSGSITQTQPFVFSCFHDYTEDKATTMFLMQKMTEAVHEQWPRDYREKDIVFCSFYDLMLDDAGILLPDGRHAGAIYRMHPLELLIEESASDGSDLGVAFMDAYATGKFHMLNPAGAMLLQSKALQALIWKLKDNEDIFQAEDREAIYNHMLPTSMTEDDFAGIKHVCKPIWGREGEDIIVSPQLAKPEGFYVYQQFADSMPVVLPTDSGVQSGYMTYSCFMLGPEASAIYGRFSPKEMAGIEAYWAPLLSNM